MVRPARMWWFTAWLVALLAGPSMHALARGRTSPPEMPKLGACFVDEWDPPFEVRPAYRQNLGYGRAVRASDGLLAIVQEGGGALDAVRTALGIQWLWELARVRDAGVVSLPRAPAQAILQTGAYVVYSKSYGLVDAVLVAADAVTGELVAAAWSGLLAERMRPEERILQEWAHAARQSTIKRRRYLRTKAGQSAADLGWFAVTPSPTTALRDEAGRRRRHVPGTKLRMVLHAGGHAVELAPRMCATLVLEGKAYRFAHLDSPEHDAFVGRPDGPCGNGCSTFVLYSLRAARAR